MLRLKVLGWSLVPALIFIVCWECLVLENSRRLFLFSSPSEVFFVALAELPTLEFWRHVTTTGTEAFVGLLLGTILGTAVGLLLSLSQTIARISMPYLAFLGAVPVIGIAPMLIIWLGTGIFSKIVMAAVGVFFVSVSHSFEGARVSESQFLGFARSIAAPPLRVLIAVVFPGALRWAVLGLKTSIGVALLGAFVAEFVSSEVGLGHYILKAGSLYDMPRVLLGIVSLSLMALSGTGAVYLIKRRYRELLG